MQRTITFFINWIKSVADKATAYLDNNIHLVPRAFNSARKRLSCTATVINSNIIIVKL